MTAGLLDIGEIIGYPGYRPKVMLDKMLYQAIECNKR